MIFAFRMCSFSMRSGAGICLILFLCANIASAQPTTTSEKVVNATQAPSKVKEEVDPQLDSAYTRFYNTYRLGPGDQIAVRIQGQPEYSKDMIKVSPVGAIYLELLGDVTIAGMTVSQAKEHLTKELSEYLKDPKVTVSLLDAVSAKVGVLGEVLRPGILLMSRPMNLMDAIMESGGFTTTGSKSNVELIRQSPDGRREPKRFNLKRVLDGKATPEENITLQPGDIVYVHGNMMKKINTVTSLAGFGGFLTFIQLGQMGRR